MSIVEREIDLKEKIDGYSSIRLETSEEKANNMYLRESYRVEEELTCN